jgi:GT2 family glycosyltransferase
MSARDPWQRLSVIVVAHDSAGVIAPCLTALAPAARVFVVDNASRDDTVAVAARTLATATVIRNPRNLGFGPACNQALALVETDFALVVNPDAVLGPGAVEALIAAADRYPEAALLGPRVATPDGRVEFGRRPVLADRRRGPDGLPAPAGDCCIDYVAGAVMLLRMAALALTGAFDPAIMLYCEDDDLCYRLRAAGYSLVVVPAATALHASGGSSPPSPALDRFRNWQHAWSRAYVEGKHRGRAAARRLALRHLLRYGTKAIGYALTLRGAKRRRDAARFAGTLAYLRGRPATDAP